MKQGTSSAHCHKAIAKVARGLAGATYEELMSSSNVLYDMAKKQTPGLTDKQRRQQFINRKWGLFIEAARATLALQLKQPIDESVKEEIMKILVLDSTLIRGRKQPMLVMGEVKPTT